MTLTFQALADILPPGSIEFVGNNQLKLNFSQLTGKTLTTDVSCVEAIVKLMQGLAALTEQINKNRLEQNPSEIPIEFVGQELTGTAEQPKYQFVVEVAVNTETFLNNLIDPTAA